MIARLRRLGTGVHGKVTGCGASAPSRNAPDLTGTLADDNAIERLLNQTSGIDLSCLVQVRAAFLR